jgi:hypothetical protein
MGKLGKHGKAAFLNIKIQYGEEKVAFNLYEELKISPEKINDELMRQPGYYGFLLLLHKKLLTEFERAKTKRNKTWGKLYLKAKEMKSTATGRLFTDDMAKAYVEKHPEFLDITEACIVAKDNADTIYSCVKAFEQRKDLIQSISSNLRNEK